MRLFKQFSSLLFVIAFCVSAFGQVEPNELSAYYGFEEMELIKLQDNLRCLRVADFNGDGRTDIAVANNREAKIEILIQTESISPADESLVVDPEDINVNALKTPSRFDRQSVGVSQMIYSLVCSDLNSDGLPDLAFYGDPKGLYVFLQKPGKENVSKSLTWQRSEKIEIDEGLVTPNGLICADLNKDGADDLALAGRDCVYIIEQTEDGSLAEPVKYDAMSQILGMDVIDLNGDSINDLLLATNNLEKPIHVRFGLETGELGPLREFFIERPYALEFCDIDGEAGNEILSIDYKSGRLTCYKFSVRSEESSEWPILFYPLPSGEGSSERDMAIGDFDGDTLVDLMVSDPAAAELIFYKQVSGIGLAEPVRFPAFSDIESLSSADTDGDGKVEIAVLSVKEKIIGKAEFEGQRLLFPEPLEISGEPLAMELADVDLDGGIDCLYISKDANDLRQMKVIYNLGTSNRTDTGLQLKELSSNPDGLKVLDVDQDGLQDVLVFVKYSLPLLIRQTSRRQFERVDSPQAQMSLIKDAALRTIAVADINGGGGDELLVAQNNFARSLVFSDHKRWEIIDQYNARSKENNVWAVGAFSIFDDEQQGRPSVFLLDGQKGRLQILKAGEDETYRFEKEIDVGNWNSAEHLKMLFAPLTGSEVKSIVLFDGDKFALVTKAGEEERYAQLEPVFNYETKIKNGRYGNLTVGDINGDAQTDIIMVEYDIVEHKGNHFEILALDSELKPIPAMRFKIFEQKSYRGSRNGGSKSVLEPRELEVADVTGDGKDDLISVIHDRIIVYPQD
ncbi:FG-GAP repeat domain-containing protein [Planctomycetota bacterium]